MVTIKKATLSRKDNGDSIDIDLTFCKVTENEKYIFVSTEIEYEKSGYKFTTISQYSKEFFSIVYEVNNEEDG